MSLFKMQFLKAGSTPNLIFFTCFIFYILEIGSYLDCLLLPYNHSLAKVVLKVYESQCTFFD